MKRRYELTDEEWLKIQHLLPPERTSKPGRPAKDNRTFVNGMIWILRSGAPWRDLPERYGPWKSVYTRFLRWAKKGILTQALEALSEEADMENLMIDASYVRAHQHSAGAKGGSNRRR